jgi:hypothetical protein
LNPIVEFLRRRKVNFQLAFGSPAGRQVLADLREFCCASSTTAVTENPHDMAIREGRRQVWLRIERAINLTPEQMYSIAEQKDKVQ